MNETTGLEATMHGVLVIPEMIFRYQRRVNTTMPANTAISMFLTGCETEIHIWNITECKSL